MSAGFAPRAIWLRRAVALALALCLAWAAPAAHGESGKALNVLLIGVDGYDPEDGGRSDAMMLLRLDPDKGEARLASFLRDAYVTIPGHGGGRLNAAYFYGGEALLKKTLSQAFGVTVDRTVRVDFALAAELTDALGGVEVEVSPEELPRLNETLAAYNLNVGLEASDGAVAESGLQLLNGRQALSYCRIRKLDSDFKRASRQRRVLEAAIEKLSEASFLSLTRLITASLGKVKTDLTLKDVNSLLPLITGKEKPAFASAQVPFPGTCADAVIDGMEVLEVDFGANKRKLSRFLAGE